MNRRDLRIHSLDLPFFIQDYFDQLPCHTKIVSASSLMSNRREIREVGFLLVLLVDQCCCCCCTWCLWRWQKVERYLVSPVDHHHYSSTLTQRTYLSLELCLGPSSHLYPPSQSSSSSPSSSPRSWRAPWFSWQSSVDEPGCRSVSLRGSSISEINVFFALE